MGRRLRVKEREIPKSFTDFDSGLNWNHFARLPSSVAVEIGALPVIHSIPQQSHPTNKPLTTWRMPVEKSTKCNSGIEFLPLLIKLVNTGTHIYASYNGGDLEVVDSDQEWIELPSFLLAERIEEVEVEALSLVENARELRVEPMSVDDWELLEADASWLESGGLLQQISIVYPNQVICLWMNGKGIARLRVLCSSFAVTNQIWPPQNFNRDDCVHSCLRLVADTQIIISPKSRTMSLTGGVSIKLRAIPSSEDYGEAMNELATILDCTIVSVLPNSVAVHPSAFMDMSEKYLDNQRVIAVIELVEVSESSSLQSSFVRVFPSALVECGHIVIHPLVRLEIGCSVYQHFVRLQVQDAEQCEEISNRMKETIMEGITRIQMEAVQMQRKISEPKWRRPNIESLYSCRVVDHSIPSFEKPALPPLDIMLGIPIPIGGYVRLPWLDNKRSSSLYRLVLEIDGKLLPEHGDFVLAEHLAPLVSEKTMSDLIHRCSDELDYGLVVDPLPKKTYVSQEHHELLKASLKRSALIMYGERGCGKTHFALSIAAAYRLRTGHSTTYLDCRKLRESHSIRMGDILTEIVSLFEQAVRCFPSVVILDDLDELVQVYATEQTSPSSSVSQESNPVAMNQSKLIADFIKEILCSEMITGKPIVLIVTCRDGDSISRSILSSMPFGNPLLVPQFNEAGRDLLFRCILDHHGELVLPDLSVSLGRKTDGYRPRDIERLVLRLYHRMHAKKESFDNILLRELETFIPIAKLGTAPDPSLDWTSWSDIGGLFEAKLQLEAAVIRPSQYRQIYARSQIRLPRGLLLFGPPGCGKTYIIPALAAACGYSLVVCRGPEILDKYIGASESKIRELFLQAASAAPSILFFDDFDALAPHRGSDHSGVTDRCVNQLLTLLDGVEDVVHTKSIYVMAATSRPDQIDRALLRPGRLEKQVYVGYSESVSEWLDLVKKISLRYALDDDVSEAIASGEFVQEYGVEFILNCRLSAADLSAAFDAARMLAIHEALASNPEVSSVVINKSHLLDAIRAARPSLTMDDHFVLERIYHIFRKDPSRNDETTGQHQLTALR